MSNSRCGEGVSLQVAKFGVLDPSAEDFALSGNEKFCIKNQGTVAVTLEVVPAMEDTDTYVEMAFDPGWNAEVIRKVKKNTGTLPALRWGY